MNARSSPSALPPRNVRAGIEYLWMALAIDIATALLDWESLPFPPEATSGEIALSLLAGIAISAFIIYKIYQGKHWARILKAALFVISSLPILLSLSSIFAGGILLGLLLLLKFGLDGYGLLLIFSASSENWFKRNKG